MNLKPDLAMNLHRLRNNLRGINAKFSLNSNIPKDP